MKIGQIDLGNRPVMLAPMEDVTDLSFRQLLEFAGTLKEAQKNGLKTEMVPGRPLYISGVSYWIPDVEKLRTTLAETLGIQLSPSARRRLEQAAREYESSIPANATEVPASDHSIGSLKSSSSSKSGKSELKHPQESTKSSSSSSRDRTTDSTTATTDARSEDTQTSQQRTDTAAPASGDAPTPGAGGKTR